MKKSRFTDGQIMTTLKQAEGGVPVPELCREHGMSSASIYRGAQSTTVWTHTTRTSKGNKTHRLHGWRHQCPQLDDQRYTTKMPRL